MESRKLDANALRSHIGYWMRVVSNSVSYAFARKLDSTGVTVAEWVVLREMYGGDNESAPSAIARLTGLSRGAVSKLIERLFKKGLVTRAEASGDRRYQDIRLTEKALSLVPKLAALADKNDEEFFSVLSGAERSSINEILRKIAKAHTLSKAPIE